MPKETPDAKTESASSTAPDATASQDDKQQAAESSTASEQQATQTEETLSDVVEKEAQAALAREAAESDAAEKISSTKEEKQQDEKAPVPDAKDEPKKEDESPKEDEVPKEFHEHPAWKRIIGERNEARDKVARLESAARANESLVEYCQKRNITDEQFQNALEVVSLINSDPAKAYERLLPLVEQLEAHTGKRLPQDLAAKVEEGVLDPETAQEVARLRSEKEFAARKQQSDAQQQQQAVVATMVSSLNDWDTNKRQTDPDFEKKADLVRGVFLSLYQAKDAQGRPLNPVRTPQDAVALAEKAYADVNKKLTEFAPPKESRRVLTSTGATTTKTKVAPKNTREAVNAMLREQHGIDLED